MDVIFLIFTSQLRNIKLNQKLIKTEIEARSSESEIVSSALQWRLVNFLILQVKWEEWLYLQIIYKKNTTRWNKISGNKIRIIMLLLIFIMRSL